MAQAQSVLQILEMLPDQQLDTFLRRLSPEAIAAIQQLGLGARQVAEDVAAEIASSVWSCLESA